MVESMSAGKRLYVRVCPNRYYKRLPSGVLITDPFLQLTRAWHDSKALCTERYYDHSCLLGCKSHGFISLRSTSGQEQLHTDSMTGAKRPGRTREVQCAVSNDPWKRRKGKQRGKYRG